MREKRTLNMFIMIFLLTSFGSVINGCSAQKILRSPDNILCGADRMGNYLPLLEGKVVGLVGNQSSLVGEDHLLDTLISHGVQIKRIFCPEHGFRGQAEAGEKVDNEKDLKTGIEIVSIYTGKNRKPSKESLMGLDVLLFDLQDVGARFYTYISSLHYVMEAAAENGIEVIILDRPNPNGFYVDGPVREDGMESFVGMHKIPVVHGMTIGEYGKMINGEGWLNDGLQCELTVIACENYDHLCTYDLPVRPSPNLPNYQSVILYPSLCFFEGSVVSLGRGTEFPFQVFGHPEMKGDFSFKPHSIPGASLHPKHENIVCHGYDLRNVDPNQFYTSGQITLKWVIQAYNELKLGDQFFTSYFNTLMGNKWVKEDIMKGLPENSIREKWQPGLEEFKKVRKKYLLYEDFE